ncbi:MAG TPA: hypothetical protein ENJ95_23695, partial [Bacteroidetes bacterium]|nr:hypothetical protein [Bacteroidota bacterium]
MDSQMSQFKESPFPDNLPLYSGLLFTPDLYFDLNDCDQVRETLDVFSEIEIRGRVIDQFGKPLKGAMIEMWHHADWGLFGMDLESSCAPTDPDGQDWKMAVTDENGGYFFKTE